MIDLTVTQVLMSLAIGYVIGSLPTGYLLTRFAGLGDIRMIGSGNVGATNVLRTGNKKLAALTLAIDMAKGTTAVLLVSMLVPVSAAPVAPVLQTTAPLSGLIAGFGAFVGHIAPLWLSFRGGKGVATFIGVLAGWWWPVALAAIAVWIATAFATRMSSLSALIGSMSATLFVVLTQPLVPSLVIVGLTVLLFVKHRKNIERLRAGTEPKIGDKA